MDSFGSLLRDLRERRRVSQASLAVRARTSQSYVSRVEAGAVVPRLDQAEHLLRCLGFDLRLDARPMPVRRDEAGRPEILAMSPEERIESMAALHNAMAEMKAGLRDD